MGNTPKLQGLDVLKRNLYFFSNKKLQGTQGIATSNKGITTRSKKLHVAPHRWVWLFPASPAGLLGSAPWEVTTRVSAASQ